MSFEDYLSKDKMIILLPVSLGSEIYQVSTDCCDVCYFDVEKSRQLKSSGLDI